MNQIKSKIYYEISTGNILTIISECQGYIEETTKEQDMKIYPRLKDKNIDEVDYIELEYVTLASIFNNVKSYKINLETKKLECEYYTQEVLETQRRQQEQQEQEAKELESRVANVSEYLGINEKSITDVENLILQSEKNRILGEM